MKRELQLVVTLMAGRKSVKQDQALLLLATSHAAVARSRPPEAPD